MQVVETTRLSAPTPAESVAVPATTCSPIGFAATGLPAEPKKWRGPRLKGRDSWQLNRIDGCQKQRTHAAASIQLGRIAERVGRIAAIGLTS